MSRLRISGGQRRAVVRAALLLVAAGFAVACGSPADGPSMAELMVSVEDAPVPDAVHDEIPLVDSAQWVELYRPDGTSNGYTLDLYKRRVPILLDMNGRIVHAWPHVRAVGRVRLDRSGRLAVIGTDDVVKEYDWDGRLTWAYRLPADHQIPHHDFIRLENGNYLILGRVISSKGDFLHEVDREGRLVWAWTASDHLDGWFTQEQLAADDATHINSVQELPPNRWFDAGDERFRPGNLLLSARSLDAILVVDRSSGKVVWTYARGLDHQHEALMIQKGRLGEGLILVFDNGYRNRFRYRQSRIVAVDPVAEREVWSYESPGFYSSVAGSQQPLANGNVLVTSSQGGRVFEVTPDGRVVWQWIPPFEPMRATRLPYDHCPQLAALPRPEERPVERLDRPAWIDAELHQLTIPEEHVVRELHGKRRQLVPYDSGCQSIVMPAGPVLRFGYGLDESRLSGQGLIDARFAIAVGDRIVHEGRVRSSDERLWHEVSMALDRPQGERVDLCVSTEIMSDAEPGVAGPRAAFWENPTVHSSVRAELNRAGRPRQPSQAEDDLQRRQLEAIGYVQ